MVGPCLSTQINLVSMVVCVYRCGYTSKTNRQKVIFRIALPAVQNIWIVQSLGNSRLGKSVLMATEMPVTLATVYEKAADTLELNPEAALLMSYS